MADTIQGNNFLDDVALAYRVNPSADGNAEASAAAKTTAETLYSDTTNSVVAKVLINTGTYLKVKFQQLVNWTVQESKRSTR